MPTYVGVDFERDDLTVALIASGYQPAQRSMFLWEGVTQYLSSEAVDKTLSAIHQAARKGDTLIFTYVDDAVVTGEHDRFPEAARWLRGTANRGEPWISGLSPTSLRDYLRTRGFYLVYPPTRVRFELNRATTVRLVPQTRVQGHWKQVATTQLHGHPGVNRDRIAGRWHGRLVPAGPVGILVQIQADDHWRTAKTIGLTVRHVRRHR